MRLNTNGAHYAAWLYPDGSGCGGNHLALLKFSGWGQWGYNGTNFLPMSQTTLAVGAGWHPLRLVCSNTVLQVYYHGTNILTATDTDTAAPPHPAGPASLDVYYGVISVSNLVAAPVP